MKYFIVIHEHARGTDIIKVKSEERPTTRRIYERTNAVIPGIVKPDDVLTPHEIDLDTWLEV